MFSTAHAIPPMSHPSGYRDEIDDALQCIEQAIAQSSRPIASTKFSSDSAVFLHLLQRVAPDIPVVWVDTGYNSRDTQLFASHMQSSYGLNVQVFRPQQADFISPPELDSAAHDEFTRTVKLEPFRRAFDELNPDLWFSSLRRYQSIHRRALVRQDVLDQGLTKVLPMLEWSADTVEWYRQEYNLPSGPDVFDPTKGLPFRECGLHTTPWHASA